jgi:hypothetical protein
MRSRATARRTAPPEPTRSTEPTPRARGRAAPPASRRAARRSTEPEPVASDAVETDELPWAPVQPQELYRQEKSRRVSRVDPEIMAEARRQLEEMMTPLGGRKRGASLAIGAAARRRKPAPKPDEFDLPEYRPGERARGGAGDADDE